MSSSNSDLLENSLHDTIVDFSNKLLPTPPSSVKDDKDKDTLLSINKRRLIKSTSDLSQTKKNKMDFNQPKSTGNKSIKLKIFAT